MRIRRLKTDVYVITNMPAAVLLAAAAYHDYAGSSLLLLTPTIRPRLFGCHCSCSDSKVSESGDFNEFYATEAISASSCEAVICSMARWLADTKEMSLFRADTYARALATTTSSLAPLPENVLCVGPPCSRP